MMVGSVGETVQERPAGGALAAAEEAKAAPAKASLHYGVSTPRWAASKLEAAQTLSAPRRRLLRLLQKELLLQLAANKQGADIDPRRRPPHAVTPESILARWITADPKRLMRGVLAFGLHAAGPSTLTAITPSAPQRPTIGFVEAEAEPTSSHTLAAASGAAAAPAPRTEAGELRVSSGVFVAAATARAVAADPFEAYTASSTTSSTTASTTGNRSSGGSISASSKELGRASVRGPGRSAEEAAIRVRKHQKLKEAGGGAGSVQLRTFCVLCLSPFLSVAGSFLCCVCLHTLKSSRRPWAEEGRNASTAKRSLSSVRSPPVKRAVGLLSIERPQRCQRSPQVQPEVCVDPSAQTAMRPSMRRFTGSASPACAGLQQPHQEEPQQQEKQEKQQQRQQEQQQQQHQQQQQQQQQGQHQDGCAGSSSERREAREAIGWRARAAAAAAEDSSWWGSTDTAGEPLVVPPLLLPLLPSIFCLHARPWPPPPTKRRRLLSRRRRGIDCFASPAVAAQCPPWGSGFAYREGQGQQAGLANTASVGADAGAGNIASPHMTPTAVVPQAAYVAAEEAAKKGSEEKGELRKAATNDAAAGEGVTSSSCLPYGCCPSWLIPHTDKTAEPAPADGLIKGCYCSSSAASLQRRTHEVLLRRRRERQSEPTFGSATAAVPAAAAPTAGAFCAAAAVRDMAATAAAATLTGQQKHEQQTPLPRFRRRSWSAEAARSAAAPAEATPATASAAAAAATMASAAEEETAPSRQSRCCQCAVAAMTTRSAAERRSAAGEPLPIAAAGATAAAAEAATAAGTEAGPCASCSAGRGGSVPSRPLSFEEADALSASVSQADEGLQKGADGEGLGKGSQLAGLGKGVDGKDVEKRLQGNIPRKGSISEGLDKGSGRGLDRGGGNGGGGGCVRYNSLARIAQGLLVGGSSLGRGSGLGVYTCRPFSRRSVICEYSGILIDRRTALLLRHMECASHVVNVQMQHLYLLGFHTPFPLLGGGAFINDGRWNTRGGEGPGICVRFRVMFDKHRATQRVVVVAVKDIPKGTELLTSYDNDYWRLQQGVHAHRTDK